MKFNKWTLGLAALGVVSLTSAARAAESTPTFVETATKGMSVYGYVDTSVEWCLSPNHNTYYNSPGGDLIPFRGGNDSSKQDGFNVNVVSLTLEKPLDESSWAAGYKFQLLAGPDAVNWNTSANADGDNEFGIKNAYVALRVPVGNGLDFKIGSWDTVIGYEVYESGNNPNFTRSYGYYIEPTEHTGILMSYKFSDMVSASLGIANERDAGINNRNRYDGTKSDWCKAYMGSVTVTAPSSWGALAGSAIYSGFVYGYEGEDRVNYYLGATLNTPVTGLTVGFAYDLFMINSEFGFSGGEYTYTQYDNVFGLYASFKATEKLTFNARAEWWNYGYSYDGSGAYSYLDDVEYCSDYYEMTLTAQYDLWANVVSRVEFRWDQACDYSEQNSFGLYANFIYKF